MSQLDRLTIAEPVAAKRAARRRSANLTGRVARLLGLRKMTIFGVAVLASPLSIAVALLLGLVLGWWWTR
jgi:hypothetical protein